MEGGYPLASLKDYLAASSLEELESRDYSIKESLDILLKDMKALREEVLEIREVADEFDVISFVNMAEDHLANYNKNIWFIESMLK
jgi:starvation-inducible DNA-binding protein